MFSDENQEIYFSISNKKKKRLSLAIIIFPKKIDENIDLFFHGLSYGLILIIYFALVKA